MRIGFSYDHGTAKYRLYIERMAEVGRRNGLNVDPVWLAGTTREFDEPALEQIDGLVLTGGSDVEPHRYGFRDADGLCASVPGRDDTEIKILNRALERELPLLAICRGMQLLNVLQGGTLHPDLAADAGHRLADVDRHPITVAHDSALAQIVGEHGVVTSSHHQAVDELGEALRAVAHHEDGTIEAIEWHDRRTRPWLAAVQWHPERMELDEPFAGRLFQAFLEATQTRG